MAFLRLTSGVKERRTPWASTESRLAAFFSLYTSVLATWSNFITFGPKLGGRKLTHSGKSLFLFTYFAQMR